jgi:hypothetical protein
MRLAASCPIRVRYIPWRAQPASPHSGAPTPEHQPSSRQRPQHQQQQQQQHQRRRQEGAAPACCSCRAAVPPWSSHRQCHSRTAPRNLLPSAACCRISRICNSSTVSTDQPDYDHTPQLKKSTSHDSAYLVQILCIFPYTWRTYYTHIHAGYTGGECTWLAVDAGRERGRHPRLEQAVLGLWSPHWAVEIMPAMLLAL